jgi:hypothetical protein
MSCATATTAMPPMEIDSCDAVGPVRVRASSPDPYAGLHGRDYIATRCLGQAVVHAPVDTDKAASLAAMIASYQSVPPAIRRTNFVFLTGADWPNNSCDRRFFIVEARASRRPA